MRLGKRNPNVRENPRVHSGSIKVKIVVTVDDAWSDYDVLQFVEINDLPKVAGMLATITASKISGKISRAREASKKR
jgi:hypothetical protein